MDDARTKDCGTGEDGKGGSKSFPPERNGAKLQFSLDILKPP